MWPSAAGEVHDSLLKEDPAWMAVGARLLASRRRHMAWLAEVAAGCRRICRVVMEGVARVAGMEGGHAAKAGDGPAMVEAVDGDAGRGVRLEFRDWERLV